VSIAFWWYKTRHHDYSPENFDVNYIHSGAAITRDRWQWVKSKANESKWILGYRGASSMRRLKDKIGHPMWNAYSCSNKILMEDVSEPKFLCHSGVNTDKFRPAPFPDKFKIMWAGTPHAGAKKFNHVMELAERFPHILAGPNRVTDPWHEFVRGYKHDEMPSFYRQGSVYVSCSDREGSPLPPKEAAAMGRPVLARKAGDLTEWMPETFLFNNHLDMVPAIEMLRDNPDILRVSGSLFRDIACKMDYKHWSGCMPDEEYCEYFKEHPFWTRLWEFYVKGEKANES